MIMLLEPTRRALRQLAGTMRIRRTSRVWTVAAAVLLLTAVVTSALRFGALDSAIATMRSDLGADSQPDTSRAASDLPNLPASAPAVAPNSAQIETRHAYASGRIATSLFEDGQQAGLTDALVLKLIEIFGWDIDFARDVKSGDTFAVIHEEKYWMGQKVGDGPILAAEFVCRGILHRALGYKDKNGVTTYYEIDGISKKQRFLRTPIELSRISSKYTDKATRFHPILKIWTAHRGIDYAAPAGTPIRATAAGRIMSIGTNGGYGKSIEIKHDAAYTTLYAHLSKYGPTVRDGSYVEQGQIIGYVGQTGLATGPHLHYEFHVRNVHRNPLEFKFFGTSIPADERQAFFAQAQPLIAQLKLIADRHVAINR
jgi:murein DD-endopeptidase MepM/ murein hydrolase activator NlpD